MDVQPDLQKAYEADVRTEMSRYVVWKPEYLEHLRIRHGVRLSAEWPRLAYVRELGGNLRSIDSTVNDWPHIQTKTMVWAAGRTIPTFPDDARRAVKILPNAKAVLIPRAGHNPHEETPDIVNAELLKFLRRIEAGRPRKVSRPGNLATGPRTPATRHVALPVLHERSTLVSAPQVELYRIANFRSGSCGAFGRRAPASVAGRTAFASFWLRSVARSDGK